MEPEPSISVVKASGEIELFSEQKVRRSVRRARIPRSLENEVVNHVRSILYERIPTHEIYQHIIEFLGKSAYPHTSGRYALKQAIMQLGPSGFPFEKFIASLLRYYGYQATTNIMIQGKCAAHEVDVVAVKDGRRAMIECKYHNTPGARCDLKVALYVQARFTDIKLRNEKPINEEEAFHEGWLVTNTKCTTDAIAYGACVGLRIIGWNFPEPGGLSDLIERKGLHPITALSSLNEAQKKYLLERGKVLCTDLLDNPQILDELGLTDAEKEKVKSETTFICSPMSLHGQKPVGSSQSSEAKPRTESQKNHSFPD